MQYAFVGKTINIAARVQDLTRLHEGVDILLTQAMQDRLDPRFRLRALPPENVRGISEPVAIYAVEGFDP